MISSLDGPNGPAYKNEHAEHNHPLALTQQPHQLEPGQRPEMWAAPLKWRGYPCFAEPGLYVPDRTHQRETTPVPAPGSEDQDEKQVGN